MDDSSSSFITPDVRMRTRGQSLSIVISDEIESISEAYGRFFNIPFARTPMIPMIDAQFSMDENGGGNRESACNDGFPSHRIRTIAENEIRVSVPTSSPVISPKETNFKITGLLLVMRC